LGKTISEFKRAANELRDTVEREVEADQSQAAPSLGSASDHSEEHPRANAG
jgi:Sec-independent protein translocase protein TatA